MTGEVLGRRVEDDVGPQRQRPLQRRRRERVVDDHERSPSALGLPPRDGRDGLRDVDDLEQRVRRRLEPDESRAFGQRLPEDVRPGGQVDIARVDPLAAMDALEIAVGPAVDVVTDDDLLARTGQLGDGGGRRRPRGEGDPVRTALEARDRALEALPRRVLRAGVLVPAARLVRRRPGHRSTSGRSAARRRRSARRVRRRRGRRRVAKASSPSDGAPARAARRRRVRRIACGTSRIRGISLTAAGSPARGSTAGVRAASHRARRPAPRHRCRRSGRRPG